MYVPLRLFSFFFFVYQIQRPEPHCLHFINKLMLCFCGYHLHHVYVCMYVHRVRLLRLVKCALSLLGDVHSWPRVGELE